MDVDVDVEVSWSNGDLDMMRLQSGPASKLPGMLVGPLVQCYCVIDNNQYSQWSGSLEP